jgi:hypothetical protein
MSYSQQGQYVPLRHPSYGSYGDMRNDSYAKEASYGDMSDRDLADRAYGYSDTPRRGDGAGGSRKKWWWIVGVVALVRRAFATRRAPAHPVNPYSSPSSGASSRAC